MKTVLFKIRGVDNNLGWGNMAYMAGRILMMDDCLVRSGCIFKGSISLTVTVEVGPMPITLSWLASMLTDRFPHTSWIIWLTTMVDLTIGVGACSSVGLSGVWSGWPLHRMLAMSANPSGGSGQGTGISGHCRGTRCRTTGVATLLDLLTLELSSSVTAAAMAMPLLT